jgi:hypothetical protein
LRASAEKLCYSDLQRFLLKNDMAQKSTNFHCTETLMKNFLPLGVLLSALLSACPAPPITPPDPPVGPEPIEIPVIPQQDLLTHTSLLIGTNELFISHLPLFVIQDHSFQIILKVELDPISKAALQEDQQQTGAKQYTFFPPEFRISDLANALRSGNTFALNGCEIARGHIERGGPTIINGANFTVTQAMHFRQLNANETDPAESKYLLFGANGENFVAHLIAGRPDFDQVMEVTAPNGVVVDFVAQEFTVPAQSSSTPLDENQVINTTLFGNDLQLTTGAENYLEFGDLQ